MTVVLRGLDQLARDDLVFEDLRVFAVKIVQKQVERIDPLRQSLLDALPLIRGHYSGDQIDRESALDTESVPVNSKSNALIHQGSVSDTDASLEFFVGEIPDPVVESTVVRTRRQRAGLRKHLIESGLVSSAFKATGVRGEQAHIRARHSLAGCGSDDAAMYKTEKSMRGKVASSPG
jgi:hypothetical protein